MRFLLREWILLLSFLGALRLSCAQPPKRGDNTDGPDKKPGQELRDNCGADLESLCSGLDGIWQLYCLYGKKDKLSSKCSDYLGSTVVGACNSDAEKLCGQFTDPLDIAECLKTNMEELSSECYKNIQNGAEKNSPIAQMEQNLKRVTAFVSVIGTIVLILASGVFCCAMHQVRSMLSVGKDVLKRGPAFWEANSEALRLVRACDANTENGPRMWTIGFFNLSYWTKEKKSVRSFFSRSPPTSDQKLAVLNEVSGELRGATVAAIMGPSGSGKTTLLKLLGGQSTSGTLSGRLGVNHCCLSTVAYGEIMRKQGFVHQQDSLLSSLTVWQTLLLAAMLRMPKESNAERKLCRAAHLMSELGLAEIADHTVGYPGGNGGGAGGGDSGGAGGGGSAGSHAISGGQRRRLSIALEMLSNPAVLLLDEPTSGLDAATSLRLVQSLHRVSRRYGTTVALTIHQPRPEVFELFDDLLLLGTGGQMVYFGPADRVVGYFNSVIPLSLQLKTQAESNPGDFVIDVLGVSHTTSDASDEESKEPHMMTPSDAENDTAQITTAEHIHKLTRQFKQSAAYQTLVQQNLGPLRRSTKIESTPASSSCSSSFGLLSNAPSWRAMTLSDSAGQYSPLATSLEQEQEPLSPGNHSDIEMTSLHDSSSHASSSSSADTSDSTTMMSTISSEQVESQRKDLLFELSSPLFLRLPVSFMARVVLSFARHGLAFYPRRTECLWMTVQMFAVAVIVSITFSYQISSPFEKPYQAMMILSIVALYTMILQYLQLLPQYMTERTIFWRDLRANYTCVPSYLLGVALTELPRAVLQSVFLLAVAYTVHPLNKGAVFHYFAYLCLIVGVLAWQAMLSCCAVLTDNLSTSYSMAFLILGSGTLFGGLAVRLNKLPMLFRPVYYLSVAAVTQRALLSNDLLCCYMSTSCNEMAQSGPLFPSDPTQQQSQALPGQQQQHRGPPSSSSFHRLLSNSSSSSAEFCPSGLQFTGDGSDVGNLGRSYLWALGLEDDHPAATLLLLLVMVILYRAIAVGIMSWRRRNVGNLKEVEETVGR